MEKQILNNLTIIIPIHEINSDLDINYFDKCIQSIDTIKEYTPKDVILVHTKSIDSYRLNNIPSYITLLHNTTDKTDFQSQINFAVNTVKTEYFSILEFDDEYSDISLISFKEYSDYYKEVSVFIPIIIDVDTNDNFLKLSNMEGLSRGLVNEGQIGLLSHQHVEHIPSITTSGAYFKTEDFINCGGLKSNINLSYMYEYFLRATHNDQKILVLPKMCYLHRNNREGSYLHKLNTEGVSKDDVTYWYDTAKKEFYFIKDREITKKL